MLRIGIVGVQNAKMYVDVMSSIPAMLFKGVYDPSLLLDRIRRSNYPSFSSLGEMCESCDAVVFASNDNINMPLIEETLRNGRHVFVENMSTYTEQELIALKLLSREAEVVLQIGHPYLYSEFFHKVKELCSQPFDIQTEVNITNERSLTSVARTEVAALLAIVQSNIRRSQINVYSVFSEIPDALRLRVDFDNGAVGSIIITKSHLAEQHTMRLIGFDSIEAADYCRQTIDYSLSDGLQKTTRSLKIESVPSLFNQLNAFQQAISGELIQGCDVELELLTQSIVDKVKAKLRVNFNVF
ncbi:MAG: hypothetical protein MJ069_10420 [Salinivirgaceae bacterium]|nr:hypothetical protein [Salinivirgaceae bacterium]